MTQQEVRDQLEQYIARYGCSLTFLATKIQLSRVTLSYFRHNKRVLTQDALQKIMNYVG